MVLLAGRGDGDEDGDASRCDGPSSAHALPFLFFLAFTVG